MGRKIRMIPRIPAIIPLEVTAEMRIGRKRKQVPEPEKIRTDPNGSYTGRPVNPEEEPVQDADDL